MVIDALIVFYAVALLTTSVVSLLKRRYLIFAAGFLTLGLAWFPGAIGMAPSDSWWARTLYDERQLARAENPERHPRRWWPVPRYLWILSIGFLLLCAFLARPTPIVGVNGKALSNSVSGSALLSDRSCRHVGGRHWVCPVYDDAVSGDVDYQVHVGYFGCWTAQREGGVRLAHEPPPRMSGCITAFDHIRLVDRLLG
jgi:hypothetical protein